MMASHDTLHVAIDAWCEVILVLYRDENGRVLGVYSTVTHYQPSPSMAESREEDIDRELDRVGQLLAEVRALRKRWEP